MKKFKTTVGAAIFGGGLLVTLAGLAPGLTHLHAG